jgi:hypothetical protein
MRDVRSASDAVLLSRARGLETACSASLRHLDRSRAGILESERGRRAPAPRRTGFERAYLDVRATLATCAAEYKGMSRMDQAGQMREQGVSIALKNQLGIRAFEGAAESYLMSLGIRVRPYGAGANPYAGSSRRN